MKLDEKKEIVKQLTEDLKKAQAVIFTNYQGLSAEKTRELRRALKKMGASFSIVKNTLIRKALQNSPWAKLNEDTSALEGPTGVTLCQDDPSPILKALLEFAKTNTLPQLKAGLYQNLFLGAAQLKELAELPSREVLLSKLLGVINNPLTRLMLTVKNPGQKLVYVLAEIAKKKS